LWDYAQTTTYFQVTPSAWSHITRSSHRGKGKPANDLIRTLQKEQVRIHYSTLAAQPQISFEESWCCLHGGTITMAEKLSDQGVRFSGGRHCAWRRESPYFSASHLVLSKRI